MVEFSHDEADDIEGHETNDLEGDEPVYVGLAYDSERDRGLLTPSDREFLLGRKTDYTDHSKKQKRNRIRRRIRNAILDFSILFEHLDDRDRETIFDPDEPERPAYTQGIVDVLAFCYLGTIGYSTSFDELLTRGVRRGEQELAGSEYRMVDVTFEVDTIGQLDVDDVIDKLEQGRFEELSDQELRAFVRLLAESEQFSADSMRAEISGRVLEFVEKTTEAAAERENRVEELRD